MKSLTDDETQRAAGLMAGWVNGLMCWNFFRSSGSACEYLIAMLEIFREFLKQWSSIRCENICYTRTCRLFFFCFQMLKHTVVF